MWWKIIVLVVIGLSSVIAAAIVYGRRRREASARTMLLRMESARIPIGPARYSSNELYGLPPPVRRYFRAVLTDGQPLVSDAIIEHTGTFNMGKAAEQWRPFSSVQRVVTRRHGFLWDGRIRMMPGLTAYVHDAYIAGEGILHASLSGLVTLAELRGTPEMAGGELMRFLAEAVWYPTALLPGQGVRWEEAGDSSARATLTDGETAVTLLFGFDEHGLIRSVRAAARGRNVAGGMVQTPWEGRWWNYELHSGMFIPVEGEVAWVLSEGPEPYWRGRITGISYEFAQ